MFGASPMLLIITNRRCKLELLLLIVVTILLLTLRQGSAFNVASVNQRGPSLTSIRSASQRQATNLWASAKNNYDDDNDDFIIPVLPDNNEVRLDPSVVSTLTIVQLKQQLRLRGLPVSGLKSELVERLLSFSNKYAAFSFDNDDDDDDDDDDRLEQQAKEKSKRQQDLATEQGADLVDVTEYLEGDDVGQRTKTLRTNNNNDDGDIVDAEFEEAEAAASNEPEVWGAQARVVDDYEGQQLIVDGLSRTVIQYKGSNQTYVAAHVVASRDALKPFLAGGTAKINATTTIATTAAEERLYVIQREREKTGHRPMHNDESSLLPNEGDENGIFANIIDRDFTDWGKYTPTGAQLSAAEVQGVLFLSDIYGAFTNYTLALAEKIAFECQPVVVMVPDLFRNDPWTGQTTSGLDEQGRTYEQWRTTHSDLRVNVDIRAAAACLRERYGVSCVVVWGTCYGGGRALEVASGVLPENGNIHDIDGSIGPPAVDPVAAIVWYPTRYNVKSLFGKSHQGTMTTPNGEPRKLSVMVVFAGLDTIPGATPNDASLLKSALEIDERVNDHIVKVFEGQKHGFAHMNLANQEPSDPFERFVDEEFGGAGRVGLDGGDAEVACLLSTAFMETYSRVFLPTIGPPISKDQGEVMWGKDVVMERFDGRKGRDVRQEIDDALDNFVEEPLGGYRVDQTDTSQEEELKKLLVAMEGPKMKDGPFAIEDDDDLATVYAKLTSAGEDFQIF